MREIEINLTLRFKIPERDFNVNGILFGLKESNSAIMLSILKVILMAIEKEAIKEFDETTYSLNGRQRERTLKTSFGDLKYQFIQLRNHHTHKTIVPLREKLMIPKYKRYLNESMEPAVGLAVHLSYGRSEREITRICKQSASRWTVWRRLHEFSDQLCQLGDMRNIPYIFLMADGTKVHLQESRGIDIGQKELRWAFASTGVGQPFDIVGIWIDKSWKYIAHDLKQRLDYDKMQILISDGGPGMEALMTEGMRQQRCVFHGKRDFPFILYQDGFKKEEQKPLKELFQSIPVMNISSKGTLEKITPEDRADVLKICVKTKQDFNDLIRILDQVKYPKTHVYLKNLSNTVSLFLDWWLEKGEWIPFTSNIIENRFSQIKNRIKRIGRRWSDEGLVKWLLVVVKKLFTPDDWGLLWKQFLNLNQPITLSYLKVSYVWVS